MTIVKTHVAVYYSPKNARSELVGRALAQGLAKLAIPHKLLSSTGYPGKPEADIAIFYGLSDGLKRIFDDYRIHRRALFVDLGYWHRRKKTRWDGYHKVCIDDRHPTAYFQRVPRDDQRVRAMELPDPAPWRASGTHILVAGMSGKAAAAEGLAAEQWERETIATLRRITSRPIIYRPKPNWNMARPILGATLDATTPLEIALRDCHVAVSHHSNVMIDALMAGVPIICEGGAASVLNGGTLADVENPAMPDGREQFMRDLSYTQWKMEEMASGMFWRFMRREGIV